MSFDNCAPKTRALKIPNRKDSNSSTSDGGVDEGLPPSPMVDYEEMEGGLLASQTSMNKLGITKSTSRDEQKRALLWALLASYLPDDVRSIERFFVHHVEYTLCRTRNMMDPLCAFQATALSVRDRLIERWKDTQIFFTEKDCKRVAYLSMEFCMGRLLRNALFNIGLQDNYRQALQNLGVDLDATFHMEKDIGLGSGGIGNLASCIIDSLATLDYPGWGYGLRFTYGMIFHKLDEGNISVSDYWLNHGNPWEIERNDVTYCVSFGGHTEAVILEDGTKRSRWIPGEEVVAVAYDTPIPGYKTFNTLNIRSFSANPSKRENLEFLCRGEYAKAIEHRQKAEAITHMMYVMSSDPKEREMRLKQQYFYVSATLQDMIRRQKKSNSMKNFHEKVAIHLNDTFASTAIPDLMRILLDEEHMTWDEAWEVTRKTFTYTTHSSSYMSAEKWPIPLFEMLLPRHLEIIYEINQRFLNRVAERWPGDIKKMRDASVIEEGNPKQVRMANLAMMGCHTVNGVSNKHTSSVMGLGVDLFSQLGLNYMNVNNGVSIRRWLHQANPELSLLISGYLRTEDWLLQPHCLTKLAQYAHVPSLQQQWLLTKLACKQNLASYILQSTGIRVDTNAMFDVHAKQVNVAQRQSMHIFGVVWRYLRIKELTEPERTRMVPRVHIFTGKPGMHSAPYGRSLIKLICDVGRVINEDKEIGGLIKVVFLPNYCVSLSELIIPAGDLSQSICAPGFESSGTSCMKFAMNGGLVLASKVAANLDVQEELHEQHMLMFGTTIEELEGVKAKISQPGYTHHAAFQEVVATLKAGTLCAVELASEILDPILESDRHLVAYDFPAYLEAIDKSDRLFVDRRKWAYMSIMACAASCNFTSDRAVREYANDVWHIKPIRRPGPMPVSMERLAHSGFLSRPHTGNVLQQARPKDSPRLFTGPHK